MKTVAIVQARLGSTRLPAKVLMDICGETMLQRVVGRLRNSNRIDQVVIATTDQAADGLLIEYCGHQGWDWFAGSENDVLSRYVGTAQEYEADQIVRVTSDCPLIDPGVVDQVVQRRSAGGANGEFNGTENRTQNGIQNGALKRPFHGDADYACNFYPNRWYPRGLDCECLTTETLLRIDRQAKEPRHREHVTLYVYENPSQFRIASVQPKEDHSKIRWTVDTEQDIELIREIYGHFGPDNFTWEDALTTQLLNPAWHTINHAVEQKVV